MTTRSRWAGLTILLLAATAGLSAELDYRQHGAVQESLSRVPPKWRYQWLQSRDIDVPGVTRYRPASTDSGLRLVGKYGRGRSWDVEGQDSIVALALGSEVALFNFADPSRPELLSETQLDYLPAQAIIGDNLLFTGRNGIDIWNVSDPQQPLRLSHLPYIVSGFAVTDSLLCFVSGDSFYCYNVANPAAPARLGACRDSGYVVTATSAVAVLLTRDLLAFIDITNPRAPRRAGGFGGNPLAAQARGSLLCATFANPNQPSASQFKTIDIRDPAHPVQLASLDSVCGVGLCLTGQYAFTSGRAHYEPMRIVNIADSARPFVAGELALPSSGEGWGTWADLGRNRAYVAWDYCGLQVIDIASISSPVLDTALLVADMALDITVDGNRAYVAACRAGLRVLDVSDPANPVELGGFDTIASTVESRTVVARDSFAYIGWWPLPAFRVVSVADPSNPQQVATCSVPTIPEDMVLRDTLIYGAGRLRFFVVNVARPRQPVLIGSCVLPGDVWDLDIEDTLAYVTSSTVVVVNIARPNNPFITATWRTMVALDVVDTILYTIGSSYVWSVDMTQPSQPAVLDSLAIPSWVSDIAVEGTRAYAGGVVAHVLDVSDQRNLREVGRWTPPQAFRRLLATDQYVYAACYDAGVCILETTAVGVAEAPVAGARLLEVYVRPSPTSGRAAIELAPNVDCAVSVLDATGRRIQLAPSCHRDGRVVSLDITRLRGGVYFVEVSTDKKRLTTKIVKQ